LSLFLSTSAGPGGTIANVSRSQGAKLSEMEPVPRIVKSASNVLHMRISNYPAKPLVLCEQMSQAKIGDFKVDG
jgi:hypothetical protein